MYMPDPESLRTDHHVPGLLLTTGIEADEVDAWRDLSSQSVGIPGQFVMARSHLAIQQFRHEPPPTS